MRVFISIAFLSVFSFACVMQNPKPDVEKNLKTAMQTFLYNAVNNDSSKVKYRVQSVVFFDDVKNNVYACEFTVNMITRQLDTTGIMRATISKDFKTVKRSI